MKVPQILLPILIVLYPILALLSVNMDWLDPQVTLRALSLSLLIAVLLLAILRLLFQDWDQASLVSALLLLLFFSYGHLYTAIRSLPDGLLLGRHRYLIPLGVAMIAFSVVWIRRTQSDLHRVVRYGTLLAAVLLVIPIFNILTKGIHARSDTVVGETSPLIPLEPPVDEPLPDIYYIILDAYAREDVLEKVFDYDNRPFLDALEERGFIIADESTPNYAQTSLSITSSLNMDFIQNLIPNFDESSTNREPLWDLIQGNRLRRSFHELGYKTVAFQTGFEGTEIRTVDQFMALKGTNLPFIGMNVFESLLFDTSAGKILRDFNLIMPELLPGLQYPYRNHRDNILFILDSLPSIADDPAATFTFAHILAPHAPFVLGPNGEHLYPDQPYNLTFSVEGDSQEELNEYISGYQGQVTYLNHRLIPIIDEILKRSDTPPIIIIQADHGPAARSGQLSYVDERMRILNAYYVPPSIRDAFYPSVTPVNSFRLILNEYFGAELDLLPDTAYFSQYREPYRFSIYKVSE